MLARCKILVSFQMKGWSSVQACSAARFNRDSGYELPNCWITLKGGALVGAPCQCRAHVQHYVMNRQNVNEKRRFTPLSVFTLFYTMPAMVYKVLLSLNPRPPCRRGRPGFNNLRMHRIFRGGFKYNTPYTLPVLPRPSLLPKLNLSVRQQQLPCHAHDFAKS